MYTSYNIPQNRNFNQRNFNNRPINNRPYPPIKPHFDNNDRFFGGGFLGPFLLGGVGGYLLGRPNYSNGPIPVFFPNNQSYPVPYPIPYSTTNYYY